jgi:hypothetical protein
MDTLRIIENGLGLFLVQGRITSVTNCITSQDWYTYYTALTLEDAERSLDSLLRRFDTEKKSKQIIKMHKEVSV